MIADPSTELQNVRMLGHWADWLALIGLTACALFTFAAPIYNWDLVAYAAAALSVLDGDVASVHAAAYEALQAALPAGDYHRQLAGSAYQQAAAANPEILHQQLPFYWVKPGFVSLLVVAAALGVNPVTAALALTSAAYGAAGLVAYAWATRHLSRSLAAVTVLACFAVPQIMMPGRYGTPDGVALFLVLLGLYLGFGLGRFGALAAALLLAITVRLDNAILFGLIVVYAAVFRHLGVAAAGLWLAAGVGLTVIIGRLAGAYGWQTLLHHSLIEPLTAPAAFVPDRPLADYVGAYAQALRWELQRQSVMLFSAMGVLAALLRWRVGGRGDATLHLVMIMGLAAWANSAVLPTEMDRRLAPAYLACLLALAVTIGDLRRRRQESRAIEQNEIVK